MREVLQLGPWPRLRSPAPSSCSSRWQPWWPSLWGFLRPWRVGATLDIGRKAYLITVTTVTVVTPHFLRSYRVAVLGGSTGHPAYGAATRDESHPPTFSAGQITAYRALSHREASS